MDRAMKETRKKIVKTSKEVENEGTLPAIADTSISRERSTHCRCRTTIDWRQY